MAQAPALIPGHVYKVLGGHTLAEEVVTILDNKPFSDSDENKALGRNRKVTVDYMGQPIYILPRFLADRPVDPSELAYHRSQQGHEAVAQPVAQPVAATLTVEAPVVVPPSFNALVQAQAEGSPINDPMDPRLDHLRPSIAKCKKYVRRKMPNGQSDVEFLLTFTTERYRDENQGYPANVALKGDTQGGKTFLVEVLAVEWAKAMGLPKPLPVFTLSGSSGVTDFDLFGQTSIWTDPVTGVERAVWLPGLVDLAARVGGILYLDEVNAMGERVTTSLHPLADHRHAFTNRNKPVPVPGDGFMPETVVANKNLWILATYNVGYRGMSDMNEAFINRFRHLVWGYDLEVERKLVPGASIHLLADALRTARNANKLRTPIGTTVLQRLSLDCETLGVKAGLEILIGMFKPSEQEHVREIIDSRSIEVLLTEEVAG